MNDCISVLHITAHLGGGIGKALSGLILNTPPESGIRHTIVCLEAPEKTQFLDLLISHGCPVEVAPDQEAFAGLIKESDIVQLEWWGHPALAAALCKGPLPAMRLLVWCHVSGISTPIFPSRMLEAAHCTIFTSPCSYEAEEVSLVLPEHRSRMDVIHSSGGFAGLTVPEREYETPLAAGYVGTLNFAKLHPRFVEYLSAVTIPGFTIRIIGDIVNREKLEEQCRQAGKPDLLQFRGYTNDVASELADINIFPYLLNPCHYGTSENALLEAMAMGVVPIVLNNPAERYLVEDGKTGLVVETPREFANALAWLADNPRKRHRISLQAAASVRKRFAADSTVNGFNNRYALLRSEEKSPIPFDEILGRTPAEWFLANQKHPGLFSPEPHFGTIDEFTLPGLVERTKGSLFHYHRHFPDDTRLAQWALKLAPLA